MPKGGMMGSNYSASTKGTPKYKDQYKIDFQKQGTMAPKDWGACGSDSPGDNMKGMKGGDYRA